MVETFEHLASKLNKSSQIVRPTNKKTLRDKCNIHISMWMSPPSQLNLYQKPSIKFARLVWKVENFTDESKCSNLQCWKKHSISIKMADTVRQVKHYYLKRNFKLKRCKINICTCNGQDLAPVSGVIWYLRMSILK